MALVYIGLGTNLGNCEANLELALKLLAPEIAVCKVAPTYDTEPMYKPDQPRFFNTACLAQTDLNPVEVLDKFKMIERAMGRIKNEENGPRTIDLDILLYDNLVMNTPKLTIPHARMHERAFVLAPLSHIARDVVHPVTGKTIAEMKAALGDFSHKVSIVDQSV